MTKLSSTTGPLFVNEKTISHAWAKAVLHILDHAGSEVSPLILSVDGFGSNGTIPEVEPIRIELDNLLRTKGVRSIDDVAFTIFPQRLWKLARGNRQKLFRYYGDAFPRYQAMNPRDNRRGLYFERMTSYGRGPCNGNQIEWILSQYEGRQGVRRSMFQASVFDPASVPMSSTCEFRAYKRRTSNQCVLRDAAIICQSLRKLSWAFATWYVYGAGDEVATSANECCYWGSETRAYIEDRC
jgi:hypothetical protein